MCTRPTSFVEKADVAKQSQYDELKKLDQLISELQLETSKEDDETATDNAFQLVETIQARLNYEIDKNRLISLRLKALKRNVDEAYSLAKKLIQSDVVSRDLKKFAIVHLNKSIEKVKPLFLQT